MSEIKYIDYVGFTFNGKHSSELGIVRTSEGSRFNENLLPTIQDKTIQVPGGDGMYHFGSYYTQRQFNISYAFDSLTEAQLNELKLWLGDKKIHTLIFDETPYKAYQAKVTGTASIKHIPFSEGATNRIYKGEGTIQFTAYDPYSYSVNKYLDQYVRVKKILQPAITIKLSESMGLDYLPWDDNKIPIPGKKYVIDYNGLKIIDTALFSEEINVISIGNNTVNVEYFLNSKDIEFHGEFGKTVVISISEIEDYNNVQEWKDAAGLLDTQGEYDKLSGNQIKLYNPGVKETDFILSLRFKNGAIPAGQIYISVDGATKGQLTLETITPIKDDEEIRINTKLNLIEGYKNGQKTGNIYNKYISAGTFFKIPVSKNMVMYLSQFNCFNSIEYKYIYF